MEIHPSARKHGVEDADIAHVITYCLYDASDQAPPLGILYLGPDRAGNLLEVKVVERDDGTEVAIHAMKMRRKYEELLGEGENKS